MIRTLIEVTGDDRWEFEGNLKAALEKLGYEPKPEPDLWRYDLTRALEARGLDPLVLVEEYRKNSGVSVA